MGVMMRAFGALHSGMYRRSGGKIGGKIGKVPILLLSTVGRKSGQKRTLPLGYYHDGDRLLVAASARGAVKHPAWYVNLRDNPRVTVEVGAETKPMIATTATGEERARLWARLIADSPFFVEHQQKITREIPIVILTEAKG